MRVALIQAQLDPRSRSSNLQRLIAAIDRAAGCVPAPDVLVLPGSCDTGGAALHRYWTEACAETVRATLAWKAREWGVYIVAGLHRRLDEHWQTFAALFDPDGDVAARSNESRPIMGRLSIVVGQGEPGSSSWNTPHGEITVLDPVGFVSHSDSGGGTSGMTLLAIPVPIVHRADDRKRLEENLGELEKMRFGGDIYVCVTFPVTTANSGIDPCGTTTYLRGPDGVTVAQVSNNDTNVVITEIPLKAVA